MRQTIILNIVHNQLLQYEIPLVPKCWNAHTYGRTMSHLEWAEGGGGKEEQNNTITKTKTKNLNGEVTQRGENKTIPK